MNSDSCVGLLCFWENEKFTVQWRQRIFCEVYSDSNLLIKSFSCVRENNAEVSGSGMNRDLWLLTGVTHSKPFCPSVGAVGGRTLWKSVLSRRHSLPTSETSLLETLYPPDNSSVIFWYFANRSWAGGWGYSSCRLRLFYTTL